MSHLLAVGAWPRRRDFQSSVIHKSCCRPFVASALFAAAVSSTQREYAEFPRLAQPT